MVLVAGRNERLGASEGASILGLGFRDGWEVWAEKTERVEPFAGNDNTRLGQLFEGPILDIAEDELGPLERDQFILAEGVDFPLAATLDARVISSGIPVEAKTSGLTGPLYGEWGDAGTDSVPPGYLVQVILQMFCAGADQEHLYAMLGGRGIVRYHFDQDPDLARVIVEKLGRWWHKHIVEGHEPPRGEGVPMEVVKRLRRVPSKVIMIEDMTAVEEFEAAKKSKSEAEKAFETAQSNLILQLGDAEAADLADGRQLTYLESKRKAYSVKESVFRTLRFKKG